MLITITPQDLWEEFVYYRKAGLHTTAFTFIRRKAELTDWQCIIGSIAHRKYDVQPGDVIKVLKTNTSVVWDEFLENEFKDCRSTMAY